MDAERTPVSTRGRSDWKRIAEALELDIIVGRLHLREHLVEDDLMRRFEASRYSVRRAFEEMQSLGLVVRSENRGVRIRGFSAKEVSDLFDLREILESAAAHSIPMPIDAAVVEKLIAIQRLHDAATEEGDYYRLFTLNNEFHRHLYSTCGNSALTDAIAKYSTQVQPIRMRFVHDERRRKQSAEEHWAMIEAIQRADNAALARICSKHLLTTKALFVNTHPGDAGLPGNSSKGIADRA